MIRTNEAFSGPVEATAIDGANVRHSYRYALPCGGGGVLLTNNADVVIDGLRAQVADLSERTAWQASTLERVTVAMMNKKAAPSTPADVVAFIMELKDNPNFNASEFLSLLMGEAFAYLGELSAASAEPGACGAVAFDPRAVFAMLSGSDQVH